MIRPKKALVITGPTASGKTGLAIELAGALGGEIISADSMQVYRGLDIGTAKPTARQREKVRHHLIDVCEACETFSVARFTELAAQAASDISGRGGLPVICGGTGLYISALLDNLQFTSEGPCHEMPQGVFGGDMLAELKELDPEAALGLHPNDKKRIWRALVMARSGLTKTKQNELSKRPPEYEYCVIGICCQSRAALYDRIDRRTDKMLAEGMLEEAKELLECRTATAAQAIGYKELAEYFAGRQTLKQASDRIKQATRNYAKRQLTWMRRMPQINWLYTDLIPDITTEALKITRLYSIGNAGIQKM